MAERDAEHTGRSSKSISCAFWSLGSWMRVNFNEFPLPPPQEKYKEQTDYKVDEDNNPIGGRDDHNNFFITMIKRLGAHIFLNCEAVSIFAHRKRLEEGEWTTCFSNAADFMCAARLGKGGNIFQIAGPRDKDGEGKPRSLSWAIFVINFGKAKNRDGVVEPLTRGRPEQMRVCVCHVHHSDFSRSTSVLGEQIAIMMYECVAYQVDIIAGDGNKACYYAHPKDKSEGARAYAQSLLQFWLRGFMATATQPRVKNFMRQAAPLRAKNFISAPYKDLKFLHAALDGIDSTTYTMAKVKETDGYGDCCMMSVLEWGHSKKGSH